MRSLMGCAVEVYRGRQRGVQGVVVHEDREAVMIALPDLSSDDTCYERKANLKTVKAKSASPLQ